MQVDFYILGDNSPRNINQMVCRLCEKATVQGMNVLIYTKSTQQAQELDNILWTFKADSFIAHTQANNEPHNLIPSALDQSETAFNYPVLISSADCIINETILEQYNQLLINLTTESPHFYSQFKRIVELVGKDSNEKETARNRYRFYRKKGYTLNKFDL